MAARHAATLNGFPLDLETISTTIEKALAVYEYPYRNGAKTEDLGETATHHRFKAYWFGPTYPAFFAVREEIKKSAVFELVHPELGVVKGRIQSMVPSWNDRDETAEVEFEFVEESIDDVEPPGSSVSRRRWKRLSKPARRNRWRHLQSKPRPPWGGRPGPFYPVS